MGKGKDPRRRRAPKPDATSDALEPQRQTQEKVDLVPPPPGRRPLLFRVLQSVRAVLGVMLDAADAAADTIRRGLEERAR